MYFFIQVIFDKPQAVIHNIMGQVVNYWQGLTQKKYTHVHKCSGFVRLFAIVDNGIQINKLSDKFVFFTGQQLIAQL